MNDDISNHPRKITLAVVGIVLWVHTLATGNTVTFIAGMVPIAVGVGQLASYWGTGRERMSEKADHEGST